MTKAARFLAKVYDKTGATLKKVIDSEMMIELPRISREASKATSDITLTLALPWDDFGYGTEIAEFFLVKLYAINEAHPSGYLVYQGFITEISGMLSRDTSHIELRLFPLESILGNAFWKSGSGQSLADYTVAYGGADIDQILSEAVTNVNTLYGTSYLTSDLGNPGLSIAVDFVEQTHLQAIERAAKFLDATWYWRVKPDGTLQLRQYADATADHRLILGTHIESLDVTRTLLDMRNGVRVEYTGPAYAFSSDSASETAYGKRQKKIADGSIQDGTSATALGDGEVARLKDVKIQTQVVVNAQYDLESILPGDTCRIVNVPDTASQMVSGVFRILRTEYDGTTMSLHLSEIARNFGVEFARAIE